MRIRNPNEVGQILTAYIRMRVNGSVFAWNNSIVWVQYVEKMIHLCVRDVGVGTQCHDRDKTELVWFTTVIAITFCL